MVALFLLMLRDMILLLLHVVIDRLLSVVCKSFYLSVRLKTFQIFIFFLTKTRPISTKPGKNGIKDCSNQGPHPFSRGIECIYTLPVQGHYLFEGEIIGPHFFLREMKMHCSR